MHEDTTLVNTLLTDMSSTKRTITKYPINLTFVKY